MRPSKSSVPVGSPEENSTTLWPVRPTFFPILHLKFSKSSRSPISCYVPSPAAQRQTLPVACVQTLDQVSWSRMAWGGLVPPRLNWHDWRRTCHARSLGTTQHWKNQCIAHISKVVSKSDTNNNSQQILLNKSSLSPRMTDFQPGACAVCILKAKTRQYPCLKDRSAFRTCVKELNW